MSEIEAWRARRDKHHLAAIDALRAIAREASPDLVESIKWNAPSFALNGEDRITLGIERKGGVRAVLHRGAKRQSDGFSFVDSDRLATWPSPDRGVLTFKDTAAIEAARPALFRLFSSWLANAR